MCGFQGQAAQCWRMVQPEYLLNLYALMDFPIHSDTIRWDCPLYILRGHRLDFLNCNVFFN